MSHRAETGKPSSHSRPRLMWILLAGALGACLPVTEVQFGELDVTVTDQVGNPIVGARVEPIGGWYWSSPRAIDTTGVNGTAQFRLPPAGYRVDVYPPNRDEFSPNIVSQTVGLDREGRALTFVFQRAGVSVAAARSGSRSPNR